MIKRLKCFLTRHSYRKHLYGYYKYLTNLYAEIAQQQSEELKEVK